MALIDARALAAPQRLLLDSAVWIAATTDVSGVVAPELLLILEQAAHDERLCVSTATVWELALLAQRGAIDFGDFPAWLADQQRPPGVTLLPITGALAYGSVTLPALGAGTDEAHQGTTALPGATEAVDRFLIATAREAGAVVVTTDPALLACAERGWIHAYDARP